MNTQIQLSDAAGSYIKKMLEKKQNTVFRLSIKKTGCSGYSYVPEIKEAINPADTIHEANDMAIYLDTSWLHLLQNIKIDYLEEDKSGLKQKRLVFSNPSESGRCGCGESFHIEGK